MLMPVVCRVKVQEEMRLGACFKPGRGETGAGGADRVQGMLALLDGAPAVTPRVVASRLVPGTLPQVGKGKPTA